MIREEAFPIPPALSAGVNSSSFGNSIGALGNRSRGIYRRSLAETTFARWNTLGGPLLRAHTFRRQATERFLKAAALNWITPLGLSLAVYTTSGSSRAKAARKYYATVFRINPHV